MSENRVGFGYDIHRLIPGDGLILGGFKVPADVRCDAHSDGDLVFHAISDAILSSLGKNDIGYYFPDNSLETLNLDSINIVKKALEFLKEDRYIINNVTVTIILEFVKLKDYKDKIKESVAKALSISEDRVAIHAKTKEKLDAVGQGKAIETYASILISKE